MEVKKPAKAPAKAPTVRKTASKSVGELVTEFNSKPSTIKKYKEKLGYKYDANDPSGLGNRITAHDVELLIKKKLLD